MGVYGTGYICNLLKYQRNVMFRSLATNQAVTRSNRVGRTIQSEVYQRLRVFSL